MGAGLVKQIAWARTNGSIYGVAHGFNGEVLGDVVLESKEDYWNIVSYDFNGRWSVCTYKGSELEQAKQKAESELIGLLEAA